MQCEQVRHLFTDYVEGDLAQPDREAVVKHLEQCAKCARELRAFDHAVVAVRSLPQAKPPAHLRERIREGIYAAAAGAPSLREARAARQRRMPIWLGAGIGAAAAAVLLMIVVALQPRGPAARLARAPEAMIEARPEGEASERGRVGGGATYEPAAPEEDAAPADEEAAPDEAETVERVVAEDRGVAEGEVGRRYAGPILPPSSRAPRDAVAGKPVGAPVGAVADLTVTPVGEEGAADRFKVRAWVEARETIPDANVLLAIREGDLDARTVGLYEGAVAKGEKREFEYEVSSGAASFAVQAEVTAGKDNRVIARSQAVRVPARARVAMAAGPEGERGDRGEAATAGERPAAGPKADEAPPALAERLNGVPTARPRAPAPTEPGRAVDSGPGGLAGGMGRAMRGPAPRGTPPAEAQKRIDVSFQNENLHQALRAVGEKAGAKVTIDQKVPDPKVTYKAQQTAVPLVFHALARKGNATAVLKGDTWHIAPKPAAGEKKNE